MGMLLRRHKTVKIPSSEKVVQTPLDYKELDYKAMRAYAKEHGIDISRYRKREEILAKLEEANV